MGWFYLFLGALCFATAEEIPIHPKDKALFSYIQEFPFDQYEKVLSGPYFFYVDAVDDVIKNCLRKGVWERHIKNLISQYAKADSTVIDIGAHIGTHTVHMAKMVGEKGRVFAFEPQPKLFRELYHNCQINHLQNIEFHWTALGNQEAFLELPPLTAYNEGGTGLQKGSTGVFVCCKRLDAFSFSSVSLIKIDVEGMERAVLDGAKQTLKKHRPVLLIEICGSVSPLTANNEQKQEIEETIQKLESLGYEVRYLGWSGDYLALPQK